MIKFWNKNIEVPSFNEYYPSLEIMNRDQKKFYKKVVHALNSDKYLDVAGNISYVFVYLYSLINKYGKKDFKFLYQKMMQLSELYNNEKKLAEYCLFWAHDCLIGMNKLETFLEKSEPKHPFDSSAVQSDLRLNIQYYLKCEADIVDLILLRSGRKNKIILEHEAAYRDFLYQANDNYTSTKNYWFEELLNELGNNPHRYKHSLFQCRKPRPEGVVFYTGINGLRIFLKKSKPYQVPLKLAGKFQK